MLCAQHLVSAVVGILADMDNKIARQAGLLCIVHDNVSRETSNYSEGMYPYLFDFQKFERTAVRRTAEISECIGTVRNAAKSTGFK